MRKKREMLSKGAASGMVALVFLVLGFQLAIFVVKVVERPGNPRSEAGPAGMTDSAPPGMTDGAGQEMTESAESGMTDGAWPGRAKDVRRGRTSLGGYARPDARSRPDMTGKGKPGMTNRSGSGMTKMPRRMVESFAFDPNTVSLEDLQRLGLSARQAESIENYRSKGGRFRSKADFQKMYVVSDSLYARLEPYIEIPKLELNGADSAALVSLRGIGPWYARKILDYRERLGGFVAKEQLLEIDGIDAERFAGLSDAVTVDVMKIRRLDLWHASDSVLARHPYLGAKGARSIVRYRELYDSTRWSLPDLVQEHVLPAETIEKFKKYIEIQ